MAAFHISATNHTGLTVSDIDRSIAFFRDVLGFEVSAKIEARGEFFEDLVGVPGAEMLVAYVSAPGHTIELLQYVKPDDRRRSELRPCDTGFVHMAFQVDDIDALLRAIRAGGFAPVGPVQTSTRGSRKGGRVVYTRDADGIVFEFQQPPPKSA